MEFRDYQKEIITKAYITLLYKRIILLAMEVRTGKTLTAFGIAQKVKAKHVLFITKKKVIDSGTIRNDYELLGPAYDLDLINYESVHKVNAKKYDLVIVDESHSLGAFPKPSKRTQAIKEIVGSKMLILLSGSPSPESYSQLYHQFWISQHTPFEETSFYKWAKVYVDIKKRYVGHGNPVNDYSAARYRDIQQKLSGYVFSYSQKEAGFTSKVIEEVLTVKMKPTTYKLAEYLEVHKVFKSKNGSRIWADTPIKLMQKVHQIYSGTIITEEGESKVLDTSKADFIKERFKDKKIAIFYKFKAELLCLMQVFGDELCLNLQQFQQSHRVIALQIVSGREGISLKQADALIFYNIDFSATSYWQARDRMTTKDRKENRVYWIFSEGGLEHDIYKKVLEKKSFTTKHYERRKKQLV